MIVRLWITVGLLLVTAEKWYWFYFQPEQLCKHTVKLRASISVLKGVCTHKTAFYFDTTIGLMKDSSFC